MAQRRSLSSAIQLSQRILDAANEQAWEQVVQMEIDRGPLIQSYFDNNSNIDANAAMELKRLNDEIVQQLVVAREKVRSEQMEFQQNSRASRAYLDIEPR